MTETTPERAPVPLFDAPADVPEGESKGYAVYNRTLGQFVGPVTSEKPGASSVKDLVPEGHSHKVVRV